MHVMSPGIALQGITPRELWHCNPLCGTAAPRWRPPPTTALCSSPPLLPCCEARILLAPRPVLADCPASLCCAAAAAHSTRHAGDKEGTSVRRMCAGGTDGRVCRTTERCCSSTHSLCWCEVNTRFPAGDRPRLAPVRSLPRPPWLALARRTGAC